MTGYLNSLTNAAFGKKEAFEVIVDDKDDILRAGGQLRGRVVIHVEAETTGKEIELTLRGKEKSIRKKGPVDMCHQHEFFSSSVTLNNIKGKPLHPGDSVVEFWVDLPAALPSSSMHRIGLGAVGFNVCYKLMATMGGVTVKSKPIAIAAAALPQQQSRDSSSFVVHPMAQTIHSSTGRNQGTITIAASVPNTHIRKGETIKLALSCRNDSLVKIQRVEAKVVELLNWGAKEGYSKTRVNKETLVKTHPNLMDNLPGVQRDNKHPHSVVDTTYRTVEEETAIQEAMHQDLVSGLNEVELVCPLHARDSYAGMLVDVRHYLKIKCLTSGGATCPSIKIPLKLGLPETIPRVQALLEQGSTTASNQLALTNYAHNQQQEASDQLPVASAVPLQEEAPVGITKHQHYKQDQQPTAAAAVPPKHHHYKSDQKPSESQPRSTDDNEIIPAESFDRRERSVEPVPLRKVRFTSVIAEKNGEAAAFEMSLSELVPMVPSN